MHGGFYSYEWLENLVGLDIHNTWVFALQEINPGVTRLLVRTKVAKFPPLWLSYFLVKILIEPAHFIMERGMLLGIRKRAEAG
jgi:hypothetical protein